MDIKVWYTNTSGKYVKNIFTDAREAVKFGLNLRAAGHECDFHYRGHDIYINSSDVDKATVQLIKAMQSINNKGISGKITKANLDTRICDVIPGNADKSTFRVHIVWLERQLEVPHEKVENFNDQDLRDYVAELEHDLANKNKKE